MTTTIFRLSGPEYEKLTPAEALDLEAVADRDPDPTKRHNASSRLGRGGYFADPSWRPSALTPLLVREAAASCALDGDTQYDPAAEAAGRAAKNMEQGGALTPSATVDDEQTSTLMNVAAVAAPATPAAGKCAPGRARHRYTKSGEVCKECGAQNPRKPARKPSLADLVAADKNTDALEAPRSKPGIVTAALEAPVLPVQETGLETATITPDRAEVRIDPSSVGHHEGRAIPGPANDTTTSDRAEGALRPGAATTGPGIVPERPNDEGAGHRPAVAAAAPPTRVASYLDFIADLEDALATAEATRPPREFAPDTEERVDWLLRKLFEDQERASRILAAAEARCAEIDGRMRYLAAKYAAPLADFVEGELPKARRGAKSIRLSEGIVGFRDEKGGPRVEDVRALERWAEAHDDPTAPRFGEWAYRVDKDRVLAHVLATGESVPGVEIREPRRLLYAQSDLRDPRGKKAMKTIQITRLAAEALVAPPADEPEEE